MYVLCVCVCVCVCVCELCALEYEIRAREFFAKAVTGQSRTLPAPHMHVPRMHVVATHLNSSPRVAFLSWLHLIMRAAQRGMWWRCDVR